MSVVRLMKLIPVAFIVVMVAATGPAGAIRTQFGNTYMERMLDTCEPGPVCVLRFSGIPSGSTVTFRVLTCFWQTAGGAEIQKITLQQFGSQNKLLAFAIHPVTANEKASKAATIPVFNQEFGMTFGPGTRPDVEFIANAAGKQEFECTLAGTVR